MVHLVTQMLWPVSRPLTQWAETSQRHACRNAMVASTAITATRRERDEVQTSSRPSSPAALAEPGTDLPFSRCPARLSLPERSPRASRQVI